MSEKDYYYEPIQKFIKEKYDCFLVTKRDGKRGGVEAYGFADVLGFSHKNKEKTAVEVIGVEIKERKNSVCRGFGQAKGYSIFCHRNYYAAPKDVDNGKTFNEEDKEIAKYLGIGLIEIRDRKAGYACYEVLKAPANVPLTKCLDTVLKAFGMPQFCSTKVN